MADTAAATEPKLSAPVGPGQNNTNADVFLIQGYVNKLIGRQYLPAAYHTLPENGTFDNSLWSAIRAIEAQYFHGMADPHGYLAPDDSLFLFLQGVANSQPLTGQRLSTEMYGIAVAMVPAGADHVESASKGSPGTPHTTPGNIRTHLPEILQALAAQNLADETMLLVALATIRAEVANFAPINEYKTNYNTSPHSKHDFDRYDSKNGNLGAPDGETYKGRGFVQLTGRALYQKIGDQIKVDLVKDPDQAINSETRRQNSCPVSIANFRWL